jgi:hypothetical protein
MYFVLGGLRGGAGNQVLAAAEGTVYLPVLLLKRFSGGRQMLRIIKGITAGALAGGALLALHRKWPLGFSIHVDSDANEFIRIASDTLHSVYKISQSFLNS